MPQFESLESRRVRAAAAAGVVSPDAASVFTQSESWSTELWNTSADFARAQLGLYGFGQTVAIIDSGIAYDHPALGGGFGINQRVVGGWDFAENDHDPYDDGPLGYHGTHVAGIVGSADDTYTGVAPGVDLVSLRVFDDQGHSEADWVEQALWWVHEHQFAFANPITTVNLSLALDDVSQTSADAIEAAFSALVTDGIFISVSAGNNFDGTTQLKYPASSDHVVPVTSVSPDGTLSDFSQRNARSLLAPGELITSTAPDYLYGFDGVTDDFISSSGTSMAAPHVAAASALLREVFQYVGYEDISQDELHEHFVNTADSVFDPITDDSYARVNLQSALESALGEDEPSVVDDDTVLGANGAIQFTGIVNDVEDLDAVAFAVTSSGTVDLTDHWYGPTDRRPTLTIEGAIQVGPAQFFVSADQDYRLVVTGGGSVGKYAATLAADAAPISALPAAPTSRSNEARYQWTAASTGWYALQIEVTDITAVDTLRVYSDAGNLLLASNNVQSHQQVELYLESAASVRVALSGGDPVAEVSVASAAMIDGSGTDFAELHQIAEHHEIVVAMSLADPIAVHRVALSTARERAAESPQRAAAVDDVLIVPIDPHWLQAIAASADLAASSRALSTSQPQSRDDEEAQVADDVFAITLHQVALRLPGE